MKKDQNWSGTLYMRPSEDTPIDTIWIQVKVKDCSAEDFMKVFETGPPIKMAQERKKVRDISDTQSLF